MLLAACGSHANAPSPPIPTGVTWPVPEGWRREAFAFPLDFAPDLPYRGTEEIRFMPDFFDAKATTFWSYSFAWILDSPASIDQAGMERDLASYFRGLAREVAGPRFDPARFRAKLEGTGEDLAGTVEIVDPFTTQKPLTLNVLVTQRACSGGRRAVIVAASPHDLADPTWRSLEAARSAFDCR